MSGGTPWGDVELPSSPTEYDLYEEVGKGATASVWLAVVKSTGLKVAIKLVDLEAQSSGMDTLIKEAQIMRRLRHPNVLPLYCSFISGCSLWMVMPFVGGGALQQILRTKFVNGMEEELVVSIARDVLQGLDYLHCHSCMHRDLKAANLLVHDDGRILLADFGVTATLEKAVEDAPESNGRDADLERSDSATAWARYASRSTFVGTPAYIAPEVMEQAEGYHQSADIWSYGITLLELAGGRPPNSKASLRQLAIATIHQPAPTLEDHTKYTQREYSQEMHDFVSWCLEKDAAKRPSSSDLLRHPWLRQARESAFLAGHLLATAPLSHAESAPLDRYHGLPRRVTWDAESESARRRSFQGPPRDSPDSLTLDTPPASCPPMPGATHAAFLAAWSDELDSSMEAVPEEARSIPDEPEEKVPDLEPEPEPDAELDDLDPALAAIVQRRIAAERKRMEREFAASKTTLMAHQKMVIESLNEREQYSRGEQRKVTAQLAEVQSDFRAARDVWRRREVELLDQVAELESKLERALMEVNLLDRISGDAWHRELDTTWD